MTRLLVPLAASFAGVCWLLALGSTVADWGGYRERGLAWLLAARGIALLLGALAGARVVQVARGSGARALFARAPAARAIRRFAFCFAAALAFTTAAQAAGWLGASGFAASRCFTTALVAALALWTAWLANPSVAPPQGARAASGEAVLAAALLVGVAVEAGLAAWSRARIAGPLFDSSDAAERIARWRLAPGQPWLGVHANSQGFPDAEFFTAGARDLAVAVVGDSFGVGVVPYAQHFATGLEERLRTTLGARYDRVAVHNVSVVSVGLSEYRWLIDEVASATNPSRTVVCVFVGNDVLDSPGWRMGRYALQGWWLWRIPHRLWLAWRAARADSPAAAGTPATEGPEPEAGSPAPFDEETFLAIELARLAVVDAGNAGAEADWARFEARLAGIHERLGDRLLVVVIPDEFQVNDALWSQLLARARDPQRFERELPQRRIAEICAARGIECLDLLAPLRAAERDAATYRPRDTHWNERGNRVAADAIAARLLDGS
jgi:hypothetical protein